jgi:hypothetical protein
MEGMDLSCHFTRETTRGRKVIYVIKKCKKVLVLRSHVAAIDTGERCHVIWKIRLNNKHDIQDENEGYKTKMHDMKNYALNKYILDKSNK